MWHGGWGFWWIFPLMMLLMIVLCVGVGFGKLIKLGDEDVFGHEVNLASKLGEDTAEGNEILVTRAAHAAIGELPNAHWEERKADYAGESTCWRVAYR